MNYEENGQNEVEELVIVQYLFIRSHDRFFFFSVWLLKYNLKRKKIRVLYLARLGLIPERDVGVYTILNSKTFSTLSLPPIPTPLSLSPACINCLAHNLMLYSQSIDVALTTMMDWLDNPYLVDLFFMDQ